MPDAEWADLADDELRARLTNRGVHPEIADVLVTYRDTAESAETITGILDA